MGHWELFDVPRLFLRRWLDRLPEERLQAMAVVQDPRLARLRDILMEEIDRSWPNDPQYARIAKRGALVAVGKMQDNAFIVPICRVLKRVHNDSIFDQEV